MSEMIWEGKSIDNAIENAINDLKCSKNDIKVDVIQEPSKGIFGMAKMAKIKVFLINDSLGNISNDTDPTERGRQILENILRKMGINSFEITSRMEEDNVILDIKSESEGLLIGRHGKTRESLQYLIDRIANVHSTNRSRFIVDIGDYLNRHKDILQKIANKAAEKVIINKSEEHLEPMSSFDRRIIHLYLKDNSQVKTFSQGDGVFRHVVIGPNTIRDENAI